MTEGLVIIPAYNEAENIEKVLRDIDELKLGLDVLVIDDGSNDNTRKIVLEAGGMVIAHPFNLGYGSALQTGFKYAKKTNINM